MVGELALQSGHDDRRVVPRDLVAQPDEEPEQRHF
jgi:hypothetical protein